MRAAITIDVDSLRFYREIHGLKGTPADAGLSERLAGASPLCHASRDVSCPTSLDGKADEEDPIYTVAMERFFALLDDARIPATLFLVGSDAPRYAAHLLPAKKLGVEIASHSFAHDYRLTTRAPAAIKDDLERAHRALVPLAPNGEVVGFRAPGYNTSPSLLTAVKELGYLYDSSLLPSPLYFAARAVAIGAYRVLQRPSQSLVGSLFAFSGRLAPYRASVTRPWRDDPEGIWELPMACEPLTRVPLFGTTWVVAGTRARELLLSRALARLPYVNFEMHAIDLLDATDRGVPIDLARAQRDLALSATKKMSAFRELFRRLRDTCEVGTLAGIARDL